MPAPIRSGLKLAQALAVVAGIVLCRLRGPIGKEIGPRVAERAFQRHADAHPAVIVELGIGQPVERRLDGGHSSDLAVAAQMLSRRNDSREPTQAQGLRQQRIGLLQKGSRRLCRDLRQRQDIEVCQPFLGPGIGQARVRVVCIGHELLAEAEHLQRMALDAPERLRRAIDQHALRGPSNPQGGCVAQPVPRKSLDPQRQLRVLGYVDIDRSNRTPDDADAALRPAGPCRDLHIRGGTIGMAVPVRDNPPMRPAAELPRFLGARDDRQDGIAVGDKPCAEARHERSLAHQKGIPGVMASSRARSWPQAHAGGRNSR